MITNNLSLKQAQLVNPAINFGIYQGIKPDDSALERSFERIDNRYNQAIQQLSAIDVALSKKKNQLHQDDKTNAWFQDYTNFIKNNILNYINAGEYGDAIRQSILSAGEIENDPKLIGRIKSNEAFKAFDDRLQKSVDAGKVSKDTAAMIRAFNQYSYDDKIDDSGNTIQGDIWTPNREFVDDINFSAIIKTAFDLISPEKASTDINNGGQTNIFTDPNTGLRSVSPITSGGHEKHGSSYQRVQEKKIIDNVIQQIINTPNGWESLKQMYDAQKYKLAQYDKQLNTWLSDPVKYADELSEYKQLERMYAPNGTISSDFNLGKFVSNMIYNNPMVKNMAYNWTTYTEDIINNEMYNSSKKDGDENDEEKPKSNPIPDRGGNAPGVNENVVIKQGIGDTPDFGSAGSTNLPEGLVQ